MIDFAKPDFAADLKDLYDVALTLAKYEKFFGTRKLSVKRVSDWDCPGFWWQKTGQNFWKCVFISSNYGKKRLWFYNVILQLKEVV